MASATGQKWTHLSLEKKVEVIRKSKDNPSIGIRALAEIFQCSKTQISAIRNLSLPLTSQMPPLVKKTRSSDINDSLYEWYSCACSKNIYPYRPQLIQKAREIAKCLGKYDFVGTNGWLDKWKQRYHIRKVTICGESGDVSGATVASWKERLPEILQRNVYNLNETGCFWRALPNRGFIEKGKWREQKQVEVYDWVISECLWKCME